MDGEGQQQQQQQIHNIQLRRVLHTTPFYLRAIHIRVHGVQFRPILEAGTKALLIHIKRDVRSSIIWPIVVHNHRLDPVSPRKKRGESLMWEGEVLAWECVLDCTLVCTMHVFCLP